MNFKSESKNKRKNINEILDEDRFYWEELIQWKELYTVI